MQQAPLAGHLAGATFRFQTDAPDLAEYARTHLAPLLKGGEASPRIGAILRWHEGQPPRDRVAAYPHLAAMERVDRDLYVKPGALHWFRVDDLRDLFLRFTWDNNRLRVEGDFFYRLSKSQHRDRAKRLWYRNRIGALRQRRFTTLLYYLVYYPCWWWLEQMQNLHPIHAAGVGTDSGVILLGGASGVGKSTLAVALATLPGARLLADSFVLHGGADVFAVCEPILLDAWSRGWLGKHGDGLIPIDWRYGLNRSGFLLPPQHLAVEGRAGMLLFPRRAPKPYVRRISAAQAHQRLSAADMIINDLRRYWAFAASIEQMVPGGLVARRETQLAHLTAAVPCFEIGLTAETSCAAALESILRLLPEKQLRVASTRP